MLLQLRMNNTRNTRSAYAQGAHIEGMLVVSMYQNAREQEEQAEGSARCCSGQQRDPPHQYVQAGDIHDGRSSTISWTVES
jgi:hypothetical protein